MFKILIAIPVIILFILVAMLFSFFAKEAYFVSQQSSYLAWEFKPQVGRFIREVFIFPEVIVATDDKNIYGLNSQTGDVLWMYPQKGDFEIKAWSDVISYSQTSFGRETKQVEIISTKDGQLLKSFELENNLFILAATKELIFLLDPTDVHKVVLARDLKTGEEVWSLSVNEQYGVWDQSEKFGPLTYQHPINFVNNMLLFRGHKFYTAVDSLSGKVKWEFPDEMGSGGFNCKSEWLDTVFCKDQVLTSDGILRNPTQMDISKRDSFIYQTVDYATFGTFYEKSNCYSFGINNPYWCLVAKDRKSNKIKWKILLIHGDIHVDPYTNLFLYNDNTLQAYKD